MNNTQHTAATPTETIDPAWVTALALLPVGYVGELADVLGQAPGPRAALMADAAMNELYRREREGQ